MSFNNGWMDEQDKQNLFSSQDLPQGWSPNSTNSSQWSPRSNFPEQYSPYSNCSQQWSSNSNASSTGQGWSPISSGCWQGSTSQQQVRLQPVQQSQSRGQARPVTLGRRKTMAEMVDIVFMEEAASMTDTDIQQMAQFVMQAEANKR